MVIDTSAIVVIRRDEFERHVFDRLIEADGVRLVSAVTLVEAACVLEGRWGTAGRSGLEHFFRLTEARD